MSATSVPGASFDLIREEFGKRVREAVTEKNWLRLEEWAKQWIQLDGQNPEAFLWLARGALALNKHSRAAYGYGRLLDFDKENEEARNFFKQNPSILSEQSEKRAQKISEDERALENPDRPVLRPDQRENLAALELELARRYEAYDLPIEASECYQASYSWFASQAAALGLARSLHRSHQGTEAIRFLRQQLYSYPSWTEGRLLLGRILMELGQKQEAQKEWQLVLQIENSNVEALNFLRNLSLSV